MCVCKISLFRVALSARPLLLNSHFGFAGSLLSFPSLAFQGNRRDEAMQQHSRDISLQLSCRSEAPPFLLRIPRISYAPSFFYYLGITNYEEYSLIQEVTEDKKEDGMGTLRRDRTLLQRDERKMEKLKAKLHTDDDCECEGKAPPEVSHFKPI